jgi:hypothetical protein
MKDAPKTHRMVIQDAVGAPASDVVYTREASGGLVAGSSADVRMIIHEAHEHTEQLREEVRRIIAAVRFARFLDLFSYLLPRKTRERVFEPAREELLEDYLTSYSHYRTLWARRWLTFCFTFRTAWMVADCIRVMLISPLGRFLLLLIPAAVRRWWWLWLLWWE